MPWLFASITAAVGQSATEIPNLTVAVLMANRPVAKRRGLGLVGELRGVGRDEFLPELPGVRTAALPISLILSQPPHLTRIQRRQSETIGIAGVGSTRSLVDHRRPTR